MNARVAAVGMVVAVPILLYGLESGDAFLIAMGIVGLVAGGLAMIGFFVSGKF